MKETIGFIGLGGMGLAMAGNLLKAGFGLSVYNRTPEKARPLVELGARLARSPAEVAVPGGVVVTMVSDDKAVEEVTVGPDGFPLPALIHDRLTATVAKGRQDVDWAGFAREVSESAGL